MRPHYMLVSTAFAINYLAQMAPSVPTFDGKGATLSYIYNDTASGIATKCADLTTDVSGYERFSQGVTSSIGKITMFAFDLFTVGLTTFAMPTLRKREFLPFVTLAAPSYARARETTVLEDIAELRDVDHRGGGGHGDSGGSSGGKDGESGGDSGNSGTSHGSHTEGITNIAPGLKSIAISAQTVCTIGLAITILSEHPYSSVALTVFSLVNHVTADWIKIGEQENQDFTRRIQKRKRAPEQHDNKASSLDDTKKGNEPAANSIRFKSKLLRRDKDFNVADRSQNIPSKIHEAGDFDNNKRDGLDVSSTATADLTQEPSLTTTTINKRQGSGGVAGISENTGEGDFNYNTCGQETCGVTDTSENSGEKDFNYNTCGREICDFNRRKVTDDPANENTDRSKALATDPPGSSSVVTITKRQVHLLPQEDGGELLEESDPEGDLPGCEDFVPSGIRPQKTGDPVVQCDIYTIPPPQATRPHQAIHATSTSSLPSKRNEARENLPSSTPTSRNTTNTSLIAFAGVVLVVIAFCGYIQFKKY